MAPKTRAQPTALDELDDARRSLQDAGMTLLQAATAAISAAAEEKVRKLRADMRKRR